MNEQALTTTLNMIKDMVAAYGLKIVGAVVVLLAGVYMARIIKSLIRRLLTQRKVDSIIVSFLVNLTHVSLVVLVIMAALSIAGVPTTSAVAVIGAAGLAIGLALQGSLSNFAAGFLLIVLRPFKKGDYIEGAGTAGIVDEMQVFNTILNTPDNRRVIVPNSKLTNDNIINYSANETRRIDLVFGVSYGDDLRKVKAVLQRIVEADPRVLKEPPAEILVSELADSSVNFIMRAWVRPNAYWPFKFETTEKVKLTFDAEGISIPFPQRDVHLFQQS